MTIVAIVAFLTLASAAPDPSSEICAKVREARNRGDRYHELSLRHSELRRLAAEERLLYAKLSYSRRRTDDLMANTDRRLAEGEIRVQEAKAAYQRLVDDLIGKVQTPWPACEPPK